MTKDISTILRNTMMVFNHADGIDKKLLSIDEIYPTSMYSMHIAMSPPFI
jgi:hypothetical protein